MAFPFRNEAPSPRPAWGTWVAILLCLGVFAFMQPAAMQRPEGTSSPLVQTLGAQQVADFQYRWALVPCAFTHGDDPSRCGMLPATVHTAGPERFTPLVTALFLHADLLHLVGNLVFLWVFGRSLEEHVGAAGVIGTFLAGGIVAFLAFLLVRPDEILPVLGASGAVAAIMGAFLVLQPRRQMLSVVYAAGLQVLYLPAWAVLTFFFATQFFTTPDEQIAWEAHVAGMVFGVVVALGWVWRDPSLRPAGRRRSPGVHADAPGADRLWPDPPDHPRTGPAATAVADLVSRGPGDGPAGPPRGAVLPPGSGHR